MDNKKDWEELEKWNEMQKEKLGITYNHLNSKEQIRKVNTIVKGLNIT